MSKEITVVSKETAKEVIDTINRNNEKIQLDLSGITSQNNIESLGDETTAAIEETYRSINKLSSKSTGTDSLLCTLSTVPLIGMMIPKEYKALRTVQTRKMSIQELTNTTVEMVTNKQETVAQFCDGIRKLRQQSEENLSLIGEVISYYDEIDATELSAVEQQRAIDAYHMRQTLETNIKRMNDIYEVGANTYQSISNSMHEMKDRFYTTLVMMDTVKKITDLAKTAKSVREITDRMNEEVDVEMETSFMNAIDIMDANADAIMKAPERQQKMDERNKRIRARIEQSRQKYTNTLSIVQEQSREAARIAQNTEESPRVLDKELDSEPTIMSGSGKSTI